jgi:hypothetical protein
LIVPFGKRVKDQELAVPLWWDGQKLPLMRPDSASTKRATEQLLRSAIHEDGGPLIHDGSEEEQGSFDSTCHKLHRFLTQRQTWSQLHP